MPVFKLSTGNLPSAIAATVVSYAKKADFAAKPTEGNRFAFVGYKVSKEDAKIADKELPQSFAVQVPTVTLDTVLAVAKGIEFLASLFVDYQDSVIVDSVNKKTLVDPTDLAALVADYFDTSRTRGGFTLKQIMTWYAEVWTPAYILRVEQRNSLSEEKGKQTEATTRKIVEAYEGYVRQIAKKECLLSETIINGVRISIEKLRELEFIDTEDEIASFIISQCWLHVEELKKTSEVVADVG